MKSSGTLLQPEASRRDDPRWLLVERIIASQTFGKSARLPQFLSYVCERTLTGRAEELNEQNIGVHVFERPDGYDPGQDNIVRVQASRLRQRLDVYFSSEGAGEEIRVIMPKGGYVPQFVVPPEPEPPSGEEVKLTQVMPPPEVSLPASNPTELESSASVSRTRHWNWVYIMPLSILSLILLGLSYAYEQRPRATFSLFGSRLVVLPTDAAHPLWAEIFGEEQPTLLIPGDSGLVLYEAQANKTIPLAEYLSGNSQTVPQINPATPSDTAMSKTGYRYTTIVDLKLVARLLQLPESFGHSEIRYARDLKLADLKEHNAILIGDKSANPWVELFEQRMNFAFDINRANRDYVVTNRKPQAGEAPAYSRQADDHSGRAYALLALLPNLNGTGYVLILEGTTMAGTEAANDFLFDGKRLANLLHPYRRPDGSFPHFEVLLETNVIGGGASESKVLAYRIHPD